VPQEKNNDETLAGQAEDVRCYLVELRGGAPFLSGADTDLLHGWLNDGIPVALILASIERVAARRRKRRIRSRMSLTSCRRELRKLVGLRDKEVVCGDGLTRLAGEISSSITDSRLLPARDVLVNKLISIDANREEDSETRARKGSAACRCFHQQMWAAISSDHKELLAAAEIELTALKNLLDDTEWSACVLQVARDYVRSQYPLVSAQEVWERIHSSPNP